MNEDDPQTIEYPNAILASYNGPAETWHDWAIRAMTGQLNIGGVYAPADLGFYTTNDELYLTEGSSSPRKCFLFSQPGNETLFSNKPLVGIGLPAFANLADAAARYVHQIPVAHNQTPYENMLVIALPEKPQIGLAEWLPGELRVQLYRDRLPDHQLDIFFWLPNRVKEAKSIRSPAKEQSLA